MPSKIPQVVFRPPADLLAKIRKSAKEKGCSMSADIIQRLKSTFKGAKP